MIPLRRYFSVVIILAGILLLHSFAVAADCTAPLWALTTQYVSGDIVAYDNSEWRAKRNTQGGANGQSHYSLCISPTCLSRPSHKQRT